MAVSGIMIEEVKGSGASAPEGQEFKQVYLTEHASLLGPFLIDSSWSESDLTAQFIDTDLVSALYTAILNSNSKFYGVIWCVGTGDLTESTISMHIEEIKTKYQVSTISILKDADIDLANGVKNALISEENQKTYYEALLTFRKAYIFDLEGLTATLSGSTVTLNIGENNFTVGDDILLSGDARLRGRFDLTARTATTISFLSDVETFTFNAGAVCEEHPDDYCLAFSDEFSTFSSTHVGIVAPTTEDNHNTALAGRISRIQVQTTPIKVTDGELVNVDVNSNYTYSHHVVLDTARAIFLKRHPENIVEVHCNDDNVMYSLTDTIKSFAQRRVTNKGKRQIGFYSFPLIGEERFDKNEVGALSAAQIASEGLEKMKTGSLKEIYDYTLKVAWITNGLQIQYSIIDINRIKIVDSYIDLVEQEEV